MTKFVQLNLAKGSMRSIYPYDLNEKARKYCGVPVGKLFIFIPTIMDIIFWNFTTI